MLSTNSSPWFVVPATPALVPRQTLCICADEQKSPNPKFWSACRDWGRKPRTLSCKCEKAEEARPIRILKDRMEGRFRDDVSELDPFKGGLVDGGTAFWHCLSVKSCDLDCDLKLSLEAVLKYNQETVVKHWKCVGIHDGGFGITPAMKRRNLVWVLRRTHISFHSYPSWKDVVEVKTRFHISRRRLRFECLIHNRKTKETVARSISLFLVMDKSTRKLSTLLDDVLREIEPHSVEYNPASSMDEKRVRQLDACEVDYIRMGLTPMWTDLNSNTHISDPKFINWTFEGIPRLLLKKYEISNLWLEYRRECGVDDDLQSLSVRAEDETVPALMEGRDLIGFNHLLLLRNGDEAARARTEWRPRCTPARSTS
ncbi:hypothetical protein MLD38_030693 [Melastoma candidum]|uniref:Uncharacterized protein n=1 Tax=Melastoma candidum TaxID=119954 RepID=A0ACB9MSK3_9MYRT|nr:hypothetical protein MLD38_030693 [Melastoma candidum]